MGPTHLKAIQLSDSALGIKLVVEVRKTGEVRSHWFASWGSLKLAATVSLILTGIMGHKLVTML